jgi:hypothetical protein
MLQIPIQPVPSQLVLCVLGGQNCQIAIYQKGSRVYVDLNSNGSNMCLAALAHNLVPLDACNSYDGFQGNLFFIDTQGLDDPQYTGMGSRWVLVYMTPAELALTQIPAAGVEIPVLNMTLSATLSAVAPAGGGNFSIAHGLSVVPVLIEILPTVPGSVPPGPIWGQAGFADAENINLVGSDTGVTATVLVYTAAAQGLILQAPAKTLLVTSTAPGPFSVPHTLGAVPPLVEMLSTSDGYLFFQDPAWDDTNVYLDASDIGVTATLNVYAPVEDALNLAGPATTLQPTSTVPGPFSVAHGLSAVPSRIEILMLSDGIIRAQSPAFDTTNVYLQASDSGCIAKILVYV